MPSRVIKPNPESSWQEYFDAAALRPLHPLYRTLEPFLPPDGRALELACGVGQGAIFLAGKAFHVLAVDALEEPLQVLRSRLTDETSPLVETKQAFLEDLVLENEPFDVVVAGFSLFFLDAENFGDVWRRIVSWVRHGGLFMGQFLGPNDSWTPDGYLVHEQKEIEELLEPFDLLHYEHVEREGSTAQNIAKFWDVTHVICRKR